MIGSGRPDVPRARWLDRALGWVERAGNRLPDPLTLFALSAAAVVIASAIVAATGVEVPHPNPARKETIRAVSLLTAAGLRRIFTEAVKNFVEFRPLGVVLVTMLGVGVAERTGFIGSVLKVSVLKVPRKLLTAALVFTGVNASLAADAGFVIVPPLGAALFAGLGRHPIAGLAAAMAGVSGGFSANLLITALDALLSGITLESARIMHPGYEINIACNYYFMLTSTFLLTAVGTLVTERVVEPRLGKWSGSGAEEAAIAPLSPVERRALIVSVLAGLLLAAGIALLVVPDGAPLRDSTLRDPLEPFYNSLIPLLAALFFVPGVLYGVLTGQIKNDKDVATMTADAMSTMGSYLVLAFAAAQLVTYFNWSNLGLLIAVGGADVLRSVGFTGIPLLLAFAVLTGCVNLFLVSASAKWALMAPIFVPMLMALGYSPELIQVTYRVGDSVTNIISPLLPYLPIVITFMRKYDPKAGLGTLFSATLPFSIAFAIVWGVCLVGWILLGIPLGPGGGLTYP